MIGYSKITRSPATFGGLGWTSFFRDLKAFFCFAIFGSLGSLARVSGLGPGVPGLGFPKSSESIFPLRTHERSGTCSLVLSPEQGNAAQTRFPSPT